jgi:hypothetical protein
MEVTLADIKVDTFTIHIPSWILDPVRDVLPPATGWAESIALDALMGYIFALAKEHDRHIIPPEAEAPDADRT